MVSQNYNRLQNNNRTNPDSQDADTSGQKAEVSHEEPDDPDDGQLHVDEFEALARASQKVPTLKTRNCFFS